jgi:hypothetical protein
MIAMKEHSKEAWEVAYRYNAVLASETRDLAAHIDAALAAERERCALIVLGATRSDVEDTALRAIAKEIRETR